MAANHLTAREVYRLQNAHEFRKLEKRINPDIETVWIIKKYDPNDERTIAPVPRYKLVTPRHEPVFIERHWIPKSETPFTVFRERTYSDPKIFHLSHPATRSQEWSTLRQMLPTFNSVSRVEQQNWGVSSSGIATPVIKMPERMPHINSCFTKYVDVMCQGHRGFKLY
ncbi:hypothetical protein BgiMline_009734 [Biomphalaria glabrata]|nr:CAunnamed protein product [Biomphalaria glabrata]